MLLECEKRAVALYNRTSPSVATIFAPPAMGTCFVWDSRTLLTCLHVVQNIARPQVTLSCGTVLTATVAHTCKDCDIAVLRLTHPLPNPLPRSPSPPCPGQLAFTITRPPDSPATVTAGLVSAVRQCAPAPKEGGQVLSNLVQVDARVTPGASGAPVLDSDGRVLGMVCAIASESGSFEGVAYAVPTSDLEIVANRRQSKM